MSAGAGSIVSEIKRRKKKLGCDILKASKCKWILGSPGPLEPMTVRLALAAAALPSRGPAGSHCPCARGSPCPPLQGFLSPWSECWHDVTFLFPHPWSLLPVLTVSCAKSRPCVPCRGCSGFGLPGGEGRDGRALFYGTGQLYIIKVMVFPVVMYRCESWIIKY